MPESFSIGQHLRRAFLTATALPLLLTAAVFSLWFYRESMTSSTETLRAQLDASASRVETHLRSHRSAIAALATLVPAANSVDASALLVDFHRHYPGFHTMLMADGEGRMIAASPADRLRPGEPPPLIADRDYFQNAAISREPYVSNVFQGRGFGSEPIVAIAQSLAPNTLEFGIVEGSLDLLPLQSVIEEATRLEGSDFLLLDAENRVIASNGDLPPLEPVDENWLRQWRDERLAFSQPFSDSGWSLWVGIESAPLITRATVFALAMALALFGSMILGLWAYTRMQSPLTTWITQTVERIASRRGDERVSLAELPPHSSREVRSIHEHIQQLLTTVFDQSEALRMSVERLESTVAERTEELSDRNHELQQRSEIISEFNAIVADQAMNATQRRESVLRLGCRAFGLRLGILARVTDGKYEVQHVLSQLESVRMERGEVLLVEDTVCSQTVASGQDVLAFHDAEHRDRMLHPAYQGLRPAAYIAAQVASPESGFYGTLNFSDSEPRDRPFAGYEIAFIRVMANWFAASLDNEHAVQVIVDRSRQLQTLTDSMPMFVAYIDNRRRFQFANQRFQLIRANVDTIVGSSADEVFSDVEGTQIGKALNEALAGSKSSIEIQFAALPGRTYLQSFTPDRDGDEIRGVFSISYDITEFKQREEDLTHKAQTDPLTDLPNRRSVEHMLSTQAQYDGSLLVIDLDGFKAINDRFGHAAGDDALKMVSTMLQAQCRTHDFAARIGGDEFIMVVNVGLKEAKKIGERLLAAMADHPVQHGRMEFCLRASIGAANLDQGFSSAFESADRAAYEAKRRGGHQVWLEEALNAES